MKMIELLTGDPSEQIVGIVLLLVCLFILLVIAYDIHRLVGFVKKVRSGDVYFTRNKDLPVVKEEKGTE